MNKLDIIIITIFISFLIGLKLLQTKSAFRIESGIFESENILHMLKYLVRGCTKNCVTVYH